MKRHAKNNSADPAVTMSVSIRLSTVIKLKTYADKAGWTLSEAVRVLLDTALEGK